MSTTLEKGAATPLIVTLGKYPWDNTPLIGKILDFNIWDRLLTKRELTNFTNCIDKKSISPQGNLVNTFTRWTIDGTLIKPITVEDGSIYCEDR